MVLPHSVLYTSLFEPELPLFEFSFLHASIISLRLFYYKPSPSFLQITFDFISGDWTASCFLCCLGWLILPCLQRGQDFLVSVLCLLLSTSVFTNSQVFQS